MVPIAYNGKDVVMVMGYGKMKASDLLKTSLKAYPYEISEM